MFLCSTFLDVNLSNFNINFKSLFCITCILFTLIIELLPYISMRYLILEKVKAQYNWRATLGVNLSWTWLNIRKQFASDLQSSLTWSFPCSVSSNVRPRYFNESTLFIVIHSTMISSQSLGIGLSIVWFWFQIKALLNFCAKWIALCRLQMILNFQSQLHFGYRWYIYSEKEWSKDWSSWNATFYLAQWWFSVVNSHILRSIGRVSSE